MPALFAAASNNLLPNASLRSHTPPLRAVACHPLRNRWGTLLSSSCESGYEARAHVFRWSRSASGDARPIGRCSPCRTYVVNAFHASVLIASNSACTLPKESNTMRASTDRAVKSFSYLTVRPTSPGAGVTRTILQRMYLLIYTGLVYIIYRLCICSVYRSWEAVKIAITPSAEAHSLWSVEHLIIKQYSH